MGRYVLLMALVLTSLHGCAENGSTNSTEVEAEYLRAVMPDSLLKTSHLDIASIENVAVLGTGEAQHLGLRVSPGQRKVHEGMRAEVSVDYPFHQRDVIRYSWRFLLPKDFAVDVPMNRWWVIGQWHDQPDVTKGETWDDFESRSPPVLIGLGQMNGKLAISLNYGQTTGKEKQQAVGPVFLERGKWHHITTVVRWSPKADGAVQVFLDGESKSIMSATGPNMNNDYQHFLKIGMYRHPGISTDNWIYLDDLEISNDSSP